MKTIRQTVNFKASPHEVYEALMNSKKHAEFTESPAGINNKAGGKFTAYDGYIEGTNLELTPDKKIVQKWRGSDWSEGHYSTATFLLQKTKSGTKLKFVQTNVPDEQYEPISHGWHEHYWNKMKRMFENYGRKNSNEKSR